MQEPASSNHNDRLLNQSPMAKFKYKVEIARSSSAGKIIFGAGNPQANVCLIGYRPDEGEESIFDGKDSSVVKHILSSLGIPQFALWSTYVVKQRGPSEDLVWKHVKPWSDFTFDELEVVRPRAVILLGVEAAWAVLGTDEPDVSKLRQTRFVHRRSPFTNFFVTHSPQMVNRHSIQGTLGMQFNQDLMAVFEVVNSYFTNTVKI